MKIKNDYHNLFAYHDAIKIDEKGVILYPVGINKFERIKFSNVRRFEVILDVQSQSYQGSYYTKLGDMKISLVTNDMGSKYTIVTKASWRKIYNLVDYKKYFSDFKMRVNGDEDGIDIPIKVYSKFGKKLLIKNSDSFLGFEIGAAALMGFPMWMIIEALLDNQFAVLEYSFLLVFLVISLALISPVIYQEYQKYQIRKMLGL